MEESTNRFAIAALRDKRSELIGQIRHLEKRIRDIRGNLAHVEGTLAVMDPKGCPTDRHGKRVTGQQGFYGHGEIPRMCRDLLRTSRRPMTIRALSKAIMAEKAIAPDEAVERMVYIRVAQYLRNAHKRGAVARSEARGGLAGLWGLKD